MPPAASMMVPTTRYSTRKHQQVCVGMLGKTVPVAMMLFSSGKGKESAQSSSRREVAQSGGNKLAFQRG
jgi:hypothetical protein